MKAKITASGLNLRKGPSTNDAVITILKKSNELDILQPDQNGWTKVQYGIYTGFVSSKYIEVIPDKVPQVMTLADRALQIAISQLGNAEIPHGSNWGKHVEKYLASVGITFPAAWCMGFVYWCVNEACKEMEIENPLEKTGGVMDQWINSKDIRVTGKPQKGDIFIMDFGKGKGHTGFVTGVVGDKVNTCEGNSNDEGSREGFEVCRKPGGRTIASCKGFLRIV
jgi:hypothetical protein